MKKLALSLMASAAGIILVVALAPLTAAEEPAPSGEAPLASFEPDAPLQEVKDPQPAPSCLPGTPLTCDDLPSTPTSTCSCTSQLLQVKCRNCDGGGGQVLQTTCTVHFACQNPPCDLQENYTRTGYSCAS